MRAIVVDEPGDAEVLRLEEILDPAPGPREVLIRVASAGLNRADIVQRRGFYPPPPGASSILGLEVAGVIDAVGDDVTGWAAGDRVMALLEGGGYAEVARARAAQTVLIPMQLDGLAAGGVPEAFITAYDNLITRARVQAGETVLIHGGAGGVGTAAIQVARANGCRVIATAGTDEKLRACRELGADVAVNYNEEDFVALTLDETGGCGADVVLDIVGAAYLDRNLAALANDGRIVVISMQGGSLGELDLAQLMRKRGTVISTSLRYRPAEQKAEIVAAFARDVVPALASGAMRPVINRVYPLEQAGDAHRFLESGDVIGKVVLQVASG